MHNKCGIDLGVIGNPVALDPGLEAYNVGCSLAAEPDLELVPWNLALVGNLEAPTIARYEKWTLGLENLKCKLLVAAQIECGLVVQE
jgi:hypothetical protein